MSSADPELVAIVTRASKEAVEKGLIKATLPPHVASGVADQLYCAIDLLKSGAKISPGKLGLILAQKGLGIFKISSGGHWDCGIAIATVLISIAKTGIGGPATAFYNAANLLYDCYNRPVAKVTCRFMLPGVGALTAISAHFQNGMKPASMLTKPAMMEVLV